jgi:signal transduction histidine kinase
MNANNSPSATPVTWPIRYQLLLPNLAVLGLAVLGAAMLGAVWAARQADRRIDRQIHGMANTLANSSFPLTDAVLAQVRDLSGATLAVTDAQGRITQSSDDLDAAFPQGIPAAPETTGAVSEVGKLQDQSGAGFLHCTVALVPRTGSAERKSLHVLFPEALWWDAVRSAVWPPLVVGLVGAACGIPVGLRLAWGMARRIERLRQQMALLAAGNFQRLTVDGPPDELRELAVAANELSDQLQDLRASIQRHERLALVGQLSAGLLHQLRNCATGARMAVQIHRKQCAADDESLDVAQRQLDLLSDHVHRYLVMRRDGVPSAVTCRLNDVLQDVARLLEPSFRHRRVALQWSSPEEEIELPLSPENLRHLLSNLLTNAIDAAGADGRVQLEVVARDASMVCIRITDSGAGLPANVAATAFEPFVTSKPEGIGLGLVICRRIAEDCGGTLTVENTPGATCFEARLPRVAHAAPTSHYQETTV